MITYFIIQSSTTCIIFICKKKINTLSNLPNIRKERFFLKEKYKFLDFVELVICEVIYMLIYYEKNSHIVYNANILMKPFEQALISHD